LEPGLVLRDNLVGEGILDAMRATPASEYVVVGRDGSVLGVLVTADVVRVLHAGGAGGPGSAPPPSSGDHWGSGPQRRPAPWEPR
jgi:hypothetical protein